MPKIPPKPYWQTSDKSLRLYHGDVIDVLRRLPSGSVQCVVTSPPYWGLRDYGTSTWEGGDSDCNHIQYKKICRKCGAKRIDTQIGIEKWPDCLGWAKGSNCAEDDWSNGCYVCRIVLVFREVRRVLRDNGTLWLNLGDTYESGSVGGESPDGWRRGRANMAASLRARPLKSPLQSGNIVGVPWRVALALQADGWILRQDIIWHKTSPMPESIKNRCTKAHEYIFLLVKKTGYFYDAEAVRVPLKQSLQEYTKMLRNKANSKHQSKLYIPNGANKRSVWTISSEPYPGAHFATFPKKLVEPCILAGTSERGACVKCGAPWKRIVEGKKLLRPRPNKYVKRKGQAGTGNSCPNDSAGVSTKTIGWYPTCNCDKLPEIAKEHAVRIRPLLERSSEIQTSQCVVLDPFVGSGTALVVALSHNRRGWGIDLSEQYLQNNAIPRIDGSLLQIPGKAHLTGRKAKPVKVGRTVRADRDRRVQ